MLDCTGGGWDVSWDNQGRHLEKETGVSAHPTSLSLEVFSPVGSLQGTMCLLESQGVLKA